MLYCPKCQDSCYFGDFCSTCGTKLVEVEVPRCKCGEKMYPGAKHCSDCGLSRKEALEGKGDFLVVVSKNGFWKRFKKFFGF